MHKFESAMIILTYGAFIGYLFLTIILANQEDRARIHNSGISSTLSTVQVLLVIGAALIVLSGMLVTSMAFDSDRILDPADDSHPVSTPKISTLTGINVLLATGVMGLAALSIILSHRARQRLQQLLGRQGRFDPQSVVHTTATVFALLILTGQIVSFVIAGGTSGLAESINEDGIPLIEVIFQAVLQVLIAFLGVGWIIRRSIPQALERLGVLLPSRDDVIQGFVTGIKLVAVLFVYAFILRILISVGVFSESALAEKNEAAKSMVEVFNTLPLAIALALSAAVGEEILFRGALQPVFGNIVISIFFVFLHTQILGGTGMVMIFTVSYMLGTLREQRNTSSAMIAHFVYNFLILIISIMTASPEAA